MASHTNQKTTVAGLTLAEVLVAIALLGIITAVAVSAFSGFNAALDVDRATSMVKTIFEKARSQTLSSTNDTAYGVHIETDRVVLFAGGIYASSSPSNEVNTLPGRTYISVISLSSGTDTVVFEKLTGKSNATGTITIASDAATTTRTITIYETGIIDVE